MIGDLVPVSILYYWYIITLFTISKYDAQLLSYNIPTNNIDASGNSGNIYVCPTFTGMFEGISMLHK